MVKNAKKVLTIDTKSKILQVCYNTKEKYIGGLGKWQEQQLRRL